VRAAHLRSREQHPFSDLDGFIRPSLVGMELPAGYTALRAFLDSSGAPEAAEQARPPLRDQQTLHSD
jgi:hypothetical protein